MNKNNPWLTIWTSPRETIKKIVAKDPNQSIWILASIIGFGYLYDLAMELPGFVVLVLLPMAVLSPFLGMVLLNIEAWIYLKVGEWLKGRAKFQVVRAAGAWSSIPMIPLIPVIMGLELIPFIRDVSISSAAFLVSLYIALLTVLFVLIVWSIVIQIGTISQVQRFSICRATVNVMAALIMSTILWLIIRSIFMFFLIGSLRAFTG
jgi:hypothetical protein